MNKENLKAFIKKTIKKGRIEEIKEMFIKNFFEILELNDFIELWEDQDAGLFESLLLVNREKDYYIFNDYHFPKEFNDYILSNIRKIMLSIFDKLEDNDIKTLVWLDYIDFLEKEDFSMFPEKTTIKFIINYYDVVLNSEKYKDPFTILEIFSEKVGTCLSKPIKKLIKKIIQTKDYNEIVLIDVYGWLGLLTEQDLYDLLNDKHLNIFKNLFVSLGNKGYEYHGFGTQIDKDIFNYFQMILPPQEAKALQEIQYKISKQLIIDYGYDEEIFHAYKIKNNHVVKLWLSYSKITNIPDSIGNLKFLKELHLRHCNVKFLPESIGNLKSLKILDLTQCSLSSLPKSFKELQNLEKLYIYNNLFDSIPESIRHIKNLKFIDIYDEDFPEILFFRKK